MIEIIRSRTAIALAVPAALLLALSKALAAIGFAVLSGPGRVRTANDLLTAGSWLAAVALGLAVVGIGWVLGASVLRRRWAEAWEAGAAAASTMLIMIGLLVSAAASPGGSEGANVVAAVGVGGWAALCVTKAARRSLIEEAERGLVRQAALWLLAGAGLVVLAVAIGLPDASITDQGLAIATSVLWALGLAAIAEALFFARRRGLIVTRRLSELLAGIGTLAGSYVAAAVVAGVVFGPDESLTGVRVGVPIVSAIAAAGFVLLALAGWNRLRELTVVPAPEAGGCGHGAPDGARFCPECGRPVAAAEPTTAVVPAQI
ncbi:MAG: hypothetical protein ACRDYB_00275 [Acidimicrobiales bacterium]